MSQILSELCGEILSQQAHDSWCLSIRFDVHSKKQRDSQMVD